MAGLIRDTAERGGSMRPLPVYRAIYTFSPQKWPHLTEARLLEQLRVEPHTASCSDTHCPSGLPTLL